MNRTIRHKKIHIEESPVDGSGIFAKRDIKKNESIALIKGSLVTHVVVDQKTSNMGQNWIGVGKNKWINPLMFHYINHSCNPNAGIKGTRTIVALKNIKRGQEIFIDYSTTEEDRLWFLKNCRCGSKKCRGVIRSIQFLPKSIFNSYLPYIPTYFQKVYRRYNKIHD